jgi:uncharacterized membrane protein
LYWILLLFVYELYTRSFISIFFLTALNWIFSFILNNSWGDIFRIENPSVWQIPIFSKNFLFPMRNIGRLCAKPL